MREVNEWSNMQNMSLDTPKYSDDCSSKEAEGTPLHIYRKRKAVHFDSHDKSKQSSERSNIENEESPRQKRRYVRKTGTEVMKPKSYSGDPNDRLRCNECDVRKSKTILRINVARHIRTCHENLASGKLLHNAKHSVDD